MKKITSLIASLIMTSQIGHSQVSTYTFSQFMGNYGAPTSGTILGTTQQDDDVNPAVLPFTFTFNGNTYNAINVCSNGYLSFNSLQGFEYNALSDVGTSQLIAPFAQDLFMGTVVTGDIASGSNTITNLSSTVGLSVGDTLNDIFMNFPSSPVITSINGSDIVVSQIAQGTMLAADLFMKNGRIIQSVSGTAPNRVCTFEYRNMTRFAVYDEVINFKVKLYEGSNNIEFDYGFYSPNMLQTSCEVGLKGVNSNDFNSRSVLSPAAWINSTAGTFISDFCHYDQVSTPVNGLVYLWQYSVCVTPTISVAANTASICAGQSNTLTASGASTYSWSNGVNGAQVVVNPSVTTVYTLTGMDGNCSSSISYTQPVVSAPDFSVISTSTMICRGVTSTITLNGAKSYTWSNGVTSSVAVLSPTISTNYTITASNGVCTSQKVIRQAVSTCVGVNEETTLAQNQAYPNPFRNQLNVVLATNSDLRLFNAIGELIYSKHENSGELQIETSELPAGLYYLVFSDAKGSETKKLIKQ